MPNNECPLSNRLALCTTVLCYCSNDCPRKIGTYLIKTQFWEVWEVSLTMQLTKPWTLRIIFGMFIMPRSIRWRSNHKLCRSHGPGARYSNVLIAFWAAAIFKDQNLQNVDVIFSPHISPTCLIKFGFYNSAFKTNKIWVLNVNSACIK